MVWWPFATKPERADTSEVTDLYSGAPLLYSTSFVVVCFGWQVELKMTQTPLADRRFKSSDLEAFVGRALTAVGLPRTDAEQVARLMILADLRGSDGHGIFRLPQYVRRIRAGGMNVRPNIRVVQETDATALVDGDNGMGHLVMQFAAQVASEKAQHAGIGWVGVRQSNHAGPAALYAMMPLARDMIGIYIAVGSANHMPPWGGIELLLSTIRLPSPFPLLKNRRSF